MTYKQHNENPEGKKTSDYVIRAIATALNKDWHDVALDLFHISLTIPTSQTATETYTEYLSEYETIPVKYETLTGKKRYRIKDICGWKGIYIVSVANHLTCVKDGELLDTWDCSEKCAYKIWKVSRE